MSITLEQKVMVGKDRLIDDLADMINSNEGYWNLNKAEKATVKRLATILMLEDNSEITLEMLNESGYINGEEEIFWNRGEY